MTETVLGARLPLWSALPFVLLLLAIALLPLIAGHWWERNRNRALVAGLLAAVATTRLLGSLLYGVSPLDALTFAGAAAALVVATLLANWIPARRAATADPLAVLRSD